MSKKPKNSFGENNRKSTLPKPGETYMLGEGGNGTNMFQVPRLGSIQEPAAHFRETLLLEGITALAMLVQTADGRTWWVRNVGAGTGGVAYEATRGPAGFSESDKRIKIELSDVKPIY